MARGGARAGAGRKKGARNRRTADIEERLQALGCDPIEGMARIALNPKNPVALRGRMFAEIAQFVAPKLRAIEHAGQIDITDLDEAKIDAELASLLKESRRGDP